MTEVPSRCLTSLPALLEVLFKPSIFFPPTFSLDRSSAPPFCHSSVGRARRGSGRRPNPPGSPFRQGPGPCGCSAGPFHRLHRLPDPEQPGGLATDEALAAGGTLPSCRAERRRWVQQARGAPPPGPGPPEGGESPGRRLSPPPRREVRPALPPSALPPAPPLLKPSSTDGRGCCPGTRLSAGANGGGGQAGSRAAGGGGTAPGGFRARDGALPPPRLGAARPFPRGSDVGCWVGAQLFGAAGRAAAGVARRPLRSPRPRAGCARPAPPAVSRTRVRTYART